VAEVYPALQEASPGGSFKYYFFEPSEHVSAIADAINMNQAGASKEIKLTGHNTQKPLGILNPRKRPFLDILAPKGSGSDSFYISESSVFMPIQTDRWREGRGCWGGGITVYVRDCTLNISCAADVVNTVPDPIFLKKSGSGI
jgi:hypothetical protein